MCDCVVAALISAAISVMTSFDKLRVERIIMEEVKDYEKVVQREGGAGNRVLIPVVVGQQTFNP